MSTKPPNNRAFDIALTISIAGTLLLSGYLLIRANMMRADDEETSCIPKTIAGIEICGDTSYGFIKNNNHFSVTIQRYYINHLFYRGEEYNINARESDIKLLPHQTKRIYVSGHHLFKIFKEGELIGIISPKPLSVPVPPPIMKDRRPASVLFCGLNQR